MCPARRDLDRLDAIPGAGAVTAGTIKGLMARGALTYWCGDAAAAIGMYEKAVAMGRQFGDRAARRGLYGHEKSLIMAGNAASLPQGRPGLQDPT